METVKELRTRLVRKATEDEAFRARLLRDPKAGVQEALGVTLPDGFEVHVHEEGSSAAHLVLPPSSRLGERDLQAAAGGVFDPTLGGLADRSGPSIMDDW